MILEDMVIVLEEKKVLTGKEVRDEPEVIGVTRRKKEINWDSTGIGESRKI